MADPALFEFLHTEMVAELWAHHSDPGPGAGARGPCPPHCLSHLSSSPQALVISCARGHQRRVLTDGPEGWPAPASRKPCHHQVRFPQEEHGTVGKARGAGAARQRRRPPCSRTRATRARASLLPALPLPARWATALATPLKAGTAGGVILTTAAPLPPPPAIKAWQPALPRFASRPPRPLAPPSPGFRV
ncbi:trafficking protein particle complex subunit 6A isoform X1 [Mirounga leonina]|uniref:trafficking protein particle complex subunit 6A isoform X1 n=1 Tax=Mirounga leonina TaxID=9715 RepID=UPI00156C4CA7|nr:trafficking protein particle complex subunit 6A isoform X1 [Mirounga leonina]